MCVPCPPGHYLPEETRCDICPIGTEPNFDRRRCVPVSSSSRKSASAAERREPTNSTAEKVQQGVFWKNQGSLSGIKKKRRKKTPKFSTKGNLIKTKQELNITRKDQSDVNGTSEWELLVKSIFQSNSTLMNKSKNDPGEGKEKDEEESDFGSEEEKTLNNSTNKFKETNRKKQKSKSGGKISDSVESDVPKKSTLKESSKKQSKDEEEAMNIVEDDSENKANGKKLASQKSTKKAKDLSKEENQLNSTAKRKTIHQISVSERKKKSALEFHYAAVTMSPIEFYYSEDNSKTTISPSLLNITNSGTNSTDKMWI